MIRIDRVARWIPGAVLPLSLLGLAACRHDRGRNGASLADAHWVARDTARKLGPGDVQITSADTTVELAIIGDSIVSGLSQKTLDKIRADMAKDSGDAKGGSFGASIASFVKNTVSSALSHEIHYPVSDVQDVRYENGSLVFYAKTGGRMHIFESTNGSRSHDADTFRPADAEAFIAAFKARKAAVH